VEINFSISINLGPRQIKLGNKVLGSCDNVIITVSEATKEELIQLRNAKVIKLVQG